MVTRSRSRVPAVLLFAALSVVAPGKATAGLDDCLKAALNTANPEDLKKAAAFAYSHPSCLSNLSPPTLVPYVALSGSLDAANQSGALDKVGLGFSTYQQCADRVNPGNAAIGQLAPVLKPVCSTLHMDCGVFEGAAANEVNAQLASEVPLLSLLPCSCAAATSGLGVEKLSTLVKQTQQCGATLAQVGEALGDAVTGVYDVGGDALALGEDAAAAAVKLGESVLKGIGSAGCAIASVWGGCGDSPPPSYKNTATAICKAHQSTWWAASKTQAPNDIWVVCNDGLFCMAQPGEPLRCMQRRTPAQRASDIAEMKAWCPQREEELAAGYHLQCHDGLCKVAVNNVASKVGVACMKLVSESEADTTPSDARGFERTTWLAGEYAYISQFDQLIIESIRRDPNASPVELLATYKCRPFLGRAEQSLCEWNGGYEVCKKLVDAGRMETCRLAGGGEYPLPTITTAALGALRGLRVDHAAPAEDASPGATIEVSDGFLANAAAKGCRPFLGRRDELLCDNPAGYDECVQAVGRGLLRQCRSSVDDQVFPGPAR